MNLAGLLLKWCGWRVDITVPDYPKCIICVAPHTSNWDFVLGKLAYASVGRKAGFLMKESWFFFPLGMIFKAIGGVPVSAKSRSGAGGSLVEKIVEMYRRRQRLVLAITPEGTRSRTDRWRTGFLHIALNADIPLVLGAIDYRRREICITDRFIPTGNIDADLEAIKAYYSQFTGLHPEKFSTAPNPTSYKHEDSRHTS